MQKYYSGVPILSLLIWFSFSVPTTRCRAEDLPNFVWIVSEDNSIHYLKHFFPTGARAPSIEAMAENGLTFDRAYSNAPVCSVARTTLATMCYGPRIGTQFHRRYKLAPMPVGLRMFPAYLRQAGYHTTNNSKKDYNAVEGQGVWDASSGKADWRSRKKSQPFFHMQSHGQSHEGRLHFRRNDFENEKTHADPNQMKLADYFPDTPLFRYTQARYHDRMKDIDDIVANTLKKLEQDGLLETTFVFYFGDHGGVLPRSKGYAYDSGLHVPLVIRIPEKFRHLVDAKKGTRISGAVEFVDFGATVLHLAGIKLPAGIDGRPFLGRQVTLEDVSRRTDSFGYADRFDEKYDLVRSLHSGRFHYMRCFQPYLPDGLQNIYRYKMLAYQQWWDLAQKKQLNREQAAFFLPRSSELLFDLESDPHEVRNLAADPAHRETLLKMRRSLSKKMRTLPDLSVYPESYLVKTGMQNPVQFGKANLKEIERLLDIADLALLPFDRAQAGIEKALSSRNSLDRFWGLTVCTTFGNSAAAFRKQAQGLLKDPEEMVQIRAAEFLGRISAFNPQERLTEIVNSTDDPIVATEALNSIVWFRDFFENRYPVKRADFHPRARGADVDDRLNYINGIPYPPRKKNQKRKIGKAGNVK